MPRVCAFGHQLVERTDASLAAGGEVAHDVPTVLEQANDDMADYLREHTTKLLNDVLYTSSNLMHNSFAMSDRWAE